MSQAVETSDGAFLDRRDPDQYGPAIGVERRQFANTYENLSPEAKELALAIDSYKNRHRRRFITYEEMHTVIVDECTGCDLCVEPCPVDCIDMVPLPTTPATWKWDYPLPGETLIATDAHRCAA